MDFDSFIMSTGYADEEIAKVNQTITSTMSGIQSVTNIGNDLIFTLSDNSTLTVTIIGLSDNNYTTTEKNKLALLNSDILSKFTYVDSQLLYDGLPISGTVDLTNYYNQTEVNNLLANKSDKSYVDAQDETKADLTHIHAISDVTNLQTEIDNKVDKDGTKVLSTNDFTDEDKQKLEVMSNGSKYIGLFSTLTDRNNYSDTLISGYWCTVESDSNYSNKKTKYYYDSTQWVYDGEYQDDSFGIDDTSTTSTSDGWSASKLVSELTLKANIDGTNIDLTSVTGDIIPVENGTQNIGSPTNRFSKIYVNEAMLSTNTLYIGDTPILGTTDDTIMIKADTDQSITMKTTGVGTTKIISASGVELSTSGMNANVNVQATGSGANANLSATNQVNLTAPNVNINGITNVTGGVTVDNLTVGGNLVMNGSTFTVEATTVKVEDNIIELNKNEVGVGVTAGKAGLKINRGDADDYLLVFDETDDMFKVGTDSALQTIATQDYVNTSVSNKVDKTSVMTVDTTNSKFIINGTLNLTPITTTQRNALTGLSSCSIVFDSDVGALMCYDGSTWYQV